MPAPTRPGERRRGRPPKAPEERAPKRHAREDERGTAAIKIRLAPEVAETLRRRAGEEGSTVSGYVAELVRRDTR